MRLWLNVKDAAEYAGVCVDTIYTACERREFYHIRIGGRRTIRMKREWIDAWFERYACGTRDARASGGGRDGRLRRRTADAEIRRYNHRTGRVE